MDQAIKLLADGPTQQLISSIQKQVDDIERFGSQNDGDERITLFSTQALRLRKNHFLASTHQKKMYQIMI